MKRRLLVGLLALSLTIQSAGMPVMAAEVSGNDTAVEETVELGSGEETLPSETGEEGGWGAGTEGDADGSGASAEVGEDGSGAGTEEGADGSGAGTGEGADASETGTEEGADGESVPASDTESEGDPALDSGEDSEGTSKPESDGITEGSPDSAEETDEEKALLDLETSVSGNEGTVSANELEAGESSEEEIVWHVYPGGEGLFQEGSLSIIERTEPIVSTYSFRSYLAAESTLTAEEAIYEGLKAGEATIDLSSYSLLPGTNAENLAAIYYGVVNDHPELYYVRTGFSYSTMNGYVYSLTPLYLGIRNDEAFNAGVDAAMEAIEGCDTQLEKAIALHDYLAINCEYDYENYLAGSASIPARSYTAYGVFVDKIAVCQGYALAYKLLCNKAGINCYMVTSDSINHAWNLIEIDGEYYQVDVTWDDPTWDLPGRVKHTNMFLSDSAFSNHWASSSDKGWEITSGSQVVNYTATSTKYDSSFWINSNAPLIIDGDYCYYLTSGSTLSGIVKRNTTTDEETLLYSSNLIGIWYVTGSSSSYWPGIYSGFFRLGNRLYFNNAKQICSIALDGSDYRTETDVLQTDSGSVYSSVLLGDGTVKYVLLDSPNHSGKKTATEVTLQGEVDTPTKEKLAVPTFSPTEGSVDAGTEIILAATNEADIYYTLDSSVPVKGEGTTQKYETPIVLEKDTTIKAYAHSELTEYEDSDVAEVTYEVYHNRLSLSAEELTLTEEEEVTIQILELPEGKTESDVSWSVSPEGHVEIDQEGNVTALLEGEATVTATVNDYKNRPVTAECRITVKVPIRYVTYVDRNNTAITTLEVESRKTATLTPENEEGEVLDMTLEGYTFNGWVIQGKEEEGVLQTAPVILKNTVLVANYTPITYKITYQNTINDLVLDTTNYPVEYTIESESITLRTPGAEREDIVFDGWYTEIDEEGKGIEGSRITTIPKGSTGNLTLYACWQVNRGIWIKDLEDTDNDSENTIAPREYTGKAIRPKLAVYYNDQELKAGTDYTLTYQNNTSVTTGAKKAGVTIRLKGIYSGSLSYSFDILAKDISEEDVLADTIVVAYNRGRLIKPVPVVTWEGKQLYNRRDFTLDYPGEDPDAVDQNIADEDLYRVPGTYIIKVKGIGNYEKEKEVKLIIADPDSQVLMSKVKVEGEFSRDYSGQPLTIDESVLQLTYEDSQGTHTLKQDVDYELEYEEAAEVGNYKVKITGIVKNNGETDYIGTRYVTFRIVGTSILTTIIDLEKERSYTGSEIIFSDSTDEEAEDRLIVKDKEGNVLEKGKDYQVECESAELGLGKVVITGLGRYYGSVTKTFRIVQTTKGDSSSGTDTSIGGSGSDNTEGSSGTAGSGGSSSDASQEEVKQLNSAEISIVVPDLVESTRAGSYRSTPILTDSTGKRLQAGVDYEVEAYYAAGTMLEKDALVEAGNNVTVSIIGKGSYSGTLSASYRIVDKGYLLSAATVTLNRDITCKGSNIIINEADLTVTMGNKLLSDSDYRIKDIRSNIERGNAVIILEGQGDFAGTRQVSIKIAAEEFSSF